MARCLAGRPAARVATGAERKESKQEEEKKQVPRRAGAHWRNEMDAFVWCGAPGQRTKLRVAGQPDTVAGGRFGRFSSFSGGTTRKRKNAVPGRHCSPHQPEASAREFTLLPRWALRAGVSLPRQNC